MNATRKYGLVACAFATLAVVALTSSPDAGAQQGPQGSAPVTVVNTPLPVDVMNSPTVGATQAGAWNVGVVGTPTVNVGNTAAAPVIVNDVLKQDWQPFQTSAGVVLEDGVRIDGAWVAIPPGKLLVIEHATVQAFLPMGQTPQFFINTNAGGSGSLVQHSLAWQNMVPANPFDIFYFTGQTRLYAKILLFVLDRGVATGPAHAFFSISGYLITF